MNRILFVDNDPDFLATRAEFVERAGYKVIKANSLVEAERCLREEWTPLAILDVRIEDDDDEVDGEGVSMASVAIATTSSPRVSLFDAPNENITAKYLMAKATNKVTPNIKTSISTNPSLTDCIDESEGAKEEENEFDSFMGKLKGKTNKPLCCSLGTTW